MRKKQFNSRRRGGDQRRDKIKLESANGTVIEALPGTLFSVRLDSGEELKAYLAGKMRLYRIRVLVGDKVIIELDQYGGKARIIKRL
jgi:translation initiation factor IF-1